MVELNRIRKSASVYNYLHQAKLFLEHSAENFTLVDSISRTMLENYWITLPVQQKPGMSQLRRLLQAVMIYGDPLHGIESDALNYLNRLPIPLTKASDAVSTWDPHHGPFTDIEDQCLLNALHAAFELGELGLEDYVLLLLFRFSGMRRSQLADLKVGDLKKVIHEDGKIQYTILIPRAKEKGAAWRSNLTPRALAPNIAALIEGFVEIQKEKWSTAPQFPGPPGGGNGWNEKMRS
jgi:integrase